MKFIELNKQLKDKVQPLYNIKGADLFLIKQALTNIKSYLIKDLEEFNYVSIEADKIKKEQVNEQVLTLPIGNDFRLVVLHNPNQEVVKFLNKFDFDTETTDFSKILDKATKSTPLKDQLDPTGLGSFANKIGNGFSDALNAVNDAKLHSERLEEDIAMGGATSIHDAMIAAEKAELSLQMAIQIRNRILNAYTEINNMAL